MIENEMTLAEIVAANQKAATVLARHRLDFCCRGEQTLGEACALAGLDPAAIGEELVREGAAEPARVGWTRRPVGELIDFIETRYHEALRRDLPVLVELARRVERVHAGKAACPRGLADHLEHVHAAVDDHLAKEERVLFPLIRAGRGEFALMPIKVMTEEHDDHGKNLRRTRELAGDFALPEEACASWRELYHGLARLESELMEHIHLENHVLFPRAMEGAESARPSVSTAR
ncbi:MAG: iron-sulfur cluster repair di-iron protein [Deltaproteobacteria bacterium]|nr:iron-sulfur cluster repair di-iron protein [Deltaproteobacteria bacterium]